MADYSIAFICEQRFHMFFQYLADIFGSFRKCLREWVLLWIMGCLSIDNTHGRMESSDENLSLTDDIGDFTAIRIVVQMAIQ